MIHFNNVSKQHGSRILYKNASFQIRPGDKIGLIGPNDAGKTTIFRILYGEEDPDSGDVSIPGRTVIRSFSQDVGKMRGRTVLEEAMGAQPASKRSHAISSAPKSASTRSPTSRWTMTRWLSC